MNALVFGVFNNINTQCAAVQMCLPNNSDGQKWRLTSDQYLQSGLRTDDGRDLFLEIVSENPARGASLQLSCKANTNAQKWSLTSAGLVSLLNQYKLDIKDANPSENAAVQMEISNGTNAQAWNFKPTTDPVPPAVGKCLVNQY